MPHMLTWLSAKWLYVGWMLALHDVIVIVCYFPQRVDETLDAAGEDSYQAEEAVPGDTVEEGKPSSNT